MSLPLNLVLLCGLDSLGHSGFRPTATQQERVQIIGEWLVSNFPDGFDRYFVSSEPRVMDIAGLMWLPGAAWEVSDNLLESKIHNMIDLLHRECSDNSVLIVCNHRAIWGLRHEIEKFPIDYFKGLVDSEDYDMLCCQAIHYTRKKMKDGSPSDRTGHRYAMRSVRPWDTDWQKGNWELVNKGQPLNNTQLLDMASRMRE